MSLLAMQGGATGSGTVTLLAPSTSTNRTLTLPDSTGTVLNDQSNIEAQVKTATNASGSAPVYACRAWVNFNGTGTVAIRASGNVSSITDNGVSEYTVNFTTAMPDANYSTTAMGDVSGGVIVSTHSGAAVPTTSAIRLRTYNVSFAGVDSAYVFVAIFR